MYNYEHFKSIIELQRKYPNVTKRLLEYAADPEGDWTTEDIYLYNSPEDVARYEVEDGWYSTALTPDYNGAPSLYEYIDYESLASALINSWDESAHYYDPLSGFVLTTSCGW